MFERLLGWLINKLSDYLYGGIYLDDEDSL